MLKGADIVLQCLRAEGVDLVFGYPGGAIMPLYDALEGSGVRHILTRHEQGAVFAAEGYARVTGKVGVAMATSGPGATNLVTGIADAKMDSVPLVCITGQVRTAMIGTDAFQETDVFGVTLSLTKWSRLVRTIDEIAEVIEACAGRSGEFDHRHDCGHVAAGEEAGCAGGRRSQAFRCDRGTAAAA